MFAILSATQLQARPALDVQSLREKRPLFDAQPAPKPRLFLPRITPVPWNLLHAGIAGIFSRTLIGARRFVRSQTASPPAER